MNKAFVREPDPTTQRCPRCGSLGEPVGLATLESFLSTDTRNQLSESANFCPFANCDVAYFDMFERFILTGKLKHPVYPKDPDAPICGCFGFTRNEIEQDVRHGDVTRTKALLAKAKSSAARCSVMAASGHSCVAAIQQFYMQCRDEHKP